MEADPIPKEFHIQSGFVKSVLAVLAVSRWIPLISDCAFNKTTSKSVYINITSVGSVTGKLYSPLYDSQVDRKHCYGGPFKVLLKNS